MNIRIGRYELSVTRWHCWTVDKPFWRAKYDGGRIRSWALGPISVQVKKLGKSFSLFPWNRKTP